MMEVEIKACCHDANAFLGSIGPTLVHIQAENLRNIVKMHFWQRAPPL